MKSTQACLTNIYCYIIVKKNRDGCFTVHLHFIMYIYLNLRIHIHSGFVPALEEFPAGRPGHGGSVHDVSLHCPSGQAGQQGAGPISSPQASEFCPGRTRAGKQVTEEIPACVK